MLPYGTPTLSYVNLIMRCILHYMRCILHYMRRLSYYMHCFSYYMRYFCNDMQPKIERIATPSWRDPTRLETAVHGCYFLLRFGLYRVVAPSKLPTNSSISLASLLAIDFIMTTMIMMMMMTIVILVNPMTTELAWHNVSFYALHNKNATDTNGQNGTKRHKTCQQICKYLELKSRIKSTGAWMCLLGFLYNAFCYSLSLLWNSFSA